MFTQLGAPGRPPKKAGDRPESCSREFAVKHEDFTSCFFVSKDVDFANSLVEENDGN